MNCTWKCLLFLLIFIYGFYRNLWKLKNLPNQDEGQIDAYIIVCPFDLTEKMKKKITHFLIIFTSAEEGLLYLVGRESKDLSSWKMCNCLENKRYLRVRHKNIFFFFTNRTLSVIELLKKCTLGNYFPKQHLALIYAFFCLYSYLLCCHY